MLSGCGFHLRGTQGFEVSVDNLYLSVGNAYRDLRNELTATFEAFEVTLVDSPRNAEYVLEVFRERTVRRAVSTTDTISVAEYEVRLEIDIGVSNRYGELLLPETTLIAERIYSFDNTSLVSNNEEEELLVEEMRRNLVVQIVRRVDVAVKNHEGASEGLSGET